MLIYLRERKQRKNGKISLYLDIYTDKSILPDGTTKYHRKYEYLNLYLIDKPKTDADKTYNKRKKQLANSIKNQRELDLQTNKHGFTSKSNYKNTNFLEYFHNVMMHIQKNLIITNLNTP